jgi:hypothetical protein
MINPRRGPVNPGRRGPHPPSAPEIRRRCQRCGCRDLERRPARHPHFAELWCPVCRAHVRWLPRPVGHEEARGLKLGFGQYAGCVLGRLPQPDQIISRMPWYRVESIRAWIASGGKGVA